MDCQRFVATVSFLHKPVIVGAAEGSQQENRLNEDLLYNLIGEPELFWFVPHFDVLYLTTDSCSYNFIGFIVIASFKILF